LFVENVVHLAQTQKAEKDANPLAGILDAVSDAVLTTDDQTIIRFANQAVTELLGYKPDELVGQPVTKLFPPAVSVDQQSCWFLDISDSSRTLRNLILQHRDGGERHVEMVLDPFAGGSGSGLVAVIRDISMRDGSSQVLTERARLADSEIRFRDFAECGADWLWEVDAEYRFTYLSPQVTAATGYSPEWHLGKTREELGLDEENVDLMRDLYQEVDDFHEFQDRIQVRRRKDGGHVWIAFSGKPIEDEHGNFAGYRGVSRDVTAAVQRENHLKSVNAELENFAYAASHDLQEPLRKIMAFGERLAEELGDDLPELPAMYLSRMSAASGRMRTLINNLLEFSRAGRPAEDAAPVDLNVTLAQVLADQDIHIRDSGATVESDSLPTVMGHDSQFYQLLGNLMANALKFRKPDTAPRVAVRTRMTEGWLVVEVSDQGIGFDDTHAERIFELFGRLHGRSKFEGTGLGLAICRKIVEHHDGRIEAHGSLQAGATFTVRFPREIVLSPECKDELVA
jgi:two-component system sensor kinase FixL